MKRGTPLVTTEVYHVFSRSIANFKIFNNPSDFLRMKNMLQYYQIQNVGIKFSQFIQSEYVIRTGFDDYFISITKGKEKIVKIIAYCLMPTHLHLILKQLKDNGITDFMRNLLNSYSHYFNIKYKRKGPLWESKFRNVLVRTDEQLLHLTRYIHLNPVTDYLIDRPNQWEWSSYSEYILNEHNVNKICEYDNVLTIDYAYANFVEDRVSYQRKLSKIKKIILE